MVLLRVAEVEKKAPTTRVAIRETVTSRGKSSILKLIAIFVGLEETSSVKTKEMAPRRKVVRVETAWLPKETTRKVDRRTF
jgi:hypothetical protein